MKLKGREKTTTRTKNSTGGARASKVEGIKGGVYGKKPNQWKVVFEETTTKAGMPVVYTKIQGKIEGSDVSWSGKVSVHRLAAALLDNGDRVDDEGEPTSDWIDYTPLLEAICDRKDIEDVVKESGAVSMRAAQGLIA